MKLDETTLIEIQDYINELDEKVGLKLETMEDVRKAIIKHKNELKNLRLVAVSGLLCDECGDGSGWYGNDKEPEYGSITMNCSKCNPEAN